MEAIHVELTVADPETSEFHALDLLLSVTGPVTQADIEAFVVDLFETDPPDEYAGWVPFMVRVP